LRIAISAYVRFANALAWHAYELALGLHRAGHEVSLFCQRDSLLAARCNGAPFRVHSKLNLNRWSPAEIVHNVHSMKQAISEFRPEVLNPHCPPGHSYFALTRNAAGRNVPLVRTVAEPRSPKLNIVNRYLHRKVTDGLIFTTDSSRTRYENLMSGVDIPSQVILPGFRGADFVGGVQAGGYRKRFKIGEDVLFAGIVARMSPEKGQEVLLEALSLLSAAEREQIFVVMAGEDSRERGQRELAEIATSFGVANRIAFLPKLDDVRPLMQELELGIITSTTSEAICRVAMEYMSFGLPVITSDVNILPEVVHDGVTGWVYPNRDAKQLARLLSQAIGDKAARRRLGASGKAAIESTFLPEREVSDTLALYAAATDSRMRRVQ
jgi:glycosyltransferase involved in cell wall biosynthesis